MVEFLTKENFADKIKTGKVMVKFTATWCRPCQAIDPMLEEVAKDNTLYKVDIDQNPEIAMQFKVKSIPTMIVFNDGQVHKTQVGGTSKENILRLFE